MASDNLERIGVEERSLLRSTSFEIEDVESAEQTHTHTTRFGGDWLNAQRAREKFPTWFRLQNICIGLAAALAILSIILLFVILGYDEAVYRTQRHETSKATASNTNVGQMAKSYRVAEGTSMAPAAATSSVVKSSARPDAIQPNRQGQEFKKPQGFKIIALIFYGRAPVVAILDCYLKKNLVSNGGFLDEVHWAINTSEQSDLEYLDELIETADSYKKIEIPGFGYNSIWEHAVKPEHLYIKIDDDIVYLNEDAIPNLVFSKLRHPESLNVVANLINSPETGWLHYHAGAVHAYLPEYEPPAPNASDASYGPKAWRASALPQWGKNSVSEDSLAEDPHNGSDMMGDHPASPPFHGHRWLPLPKGEENLYRTPIAQSQYNAFGPDWTSWAIGAQVQYSLLENIEKNQLSKYYYGSGLDDAREGIWNMAYERMNINVMVIWGQDVLANLPFQDSDDEQELSVNLPLKLRRPLLVNTHVIAGHLSFGTQREIYETDLLSRYRAYANEMICSPEHQIKIP